MNPTVEVYGGQGAAALKVHEHGSQLPFTGLDVWLLVVGAVVLIAIGLLMARAAKAGG